MEKRTIYHVQIKFPHTGWRLASQVYTKRTAEKELTKWRQHIGRSAGDVQKARIVPVQRRTKGLAKISRSGRVLGWT